MGLKNNGGNIMKSADIVKEIMKQRGHTYESLASELGYVITDTKGKSKGRANMVSERLRGKQEMRVDTLVKFIEAMGCELVVRSKLKDKSQWVVNFTNEEE